MSNTGACLRPLPPMPVVAERGDINSMKALLEEGTHVDDRGTGSKTGIMLAAKNSKGDAVDFLIGAKADVNGVDPNTQQDVLQHACQGKDATIIVALINAGCKVSHADKTGRNCLDFAQEAKMKHAILTSLMSRMDLRRSPSEQEDATIALHAAASIGDIERAKELLHPREGDRTVSVTVDSVDHLGRTCLHWACFLSMSNSIDFLIGEGADPEKRASVGLDAIWGAGLWDFRLKSKAGDANVASDVTPLGPCPVDFIHRQHSGRVLAKSVIDMSLGRRQEDDFVAASCRALAAESRVAKEASRLEAEGLQPDKDIEEVARPRKEDDEQEEKQEEVTVEKSLQDLKLGGGKDPQHLLEVALRLASIFVLSDEAKELIAAGVNIKSAEPHSGMTSLHLACHFGAAEVAKMLIDAGGEKDARDVYGRTCRDVCPEGSNLIAMLD
uniref:Uncharacterized protein n=1 Tax=Guillardia theta TaxID=55529 RepID=A0A7S4KTT5_GUITH